MRWWGATMDASACYGCSVPGTGFQVTGYRFHSFLKTKSLCMFCNVNVTVRVICLHTGACLWRHGVKDLKSCQF